MAVIKQFVDENQDKKIMIFVETKRECAMFEKISGINFLTLHGDLSQVQRERALNKFKRPGSRFILVGTDVASRGLDIENIDVVIQMGCRHIDSFVHRAGRTARKGKDGMNVLFFEHDKMRFVLDLEQKLNLNIEFTNRIQ